MNANLLIVSSEDFPNPLFLRLEKSGFTCLYSRGVLKTREILSKQQIDAIVWVFMGHENALGRDLTNVFNQYPRIPIVFITQNYEQLDFAEEIKTIFANLDLNDDLGDIIRTTGTACNQSIITEQQTVIEDTNEIEFKNIVSEIFGNAEDSITPKKANQGNKLHQMEIWEAVDKKEKQILAGRVSTQEKKSLFPKLKTLLKRP